MIPFIRKAAKEEVEPIKDKADLTAATEVWVWPNDKSEPDVAVIRQCVELDPVFFAPTSGNSRKAFFAWGLLNMLKATGVGEVYFNVDAEGTEDYVAILEKMGAVKTTAKPQFRFKLGL